MKTRDYVCQECTHHAILLVDTTEDHWQDRECTECGGIFKFKMHVNISTSKLNQSIPDAVAKNRFKEHKEERAWKKAIRKAKNSGNKQEAAEIKREFTRISQKKP
jgi:hypothetical protein